MLTPIAVRLSEQWQRFAEAAATPSLAAIERQRPEAAWLLVDGHDRLAGRCSLWWSQGPHLAGTRLGLLGHYAVRDAEAAALLLRLAGDELAQRGCTLAVGPIDGSTWHSYRLVLERGCEPPFFLEPNHPDDWPDHFAAAGFTPWAHYYSALNDDLTQTDPQADALAQRAAAAGVRLRTLDVSDLDAELRRIHALSLVSFCDNVLFTPIAFTDFRAAYLALRDVVRPELVLLAEQDGALVGYVFGVPDLLPARRGQPIDTFILKTLAIHPSLKGVGLGRLLAARCHDAARRLGFRRAIHALMEETSRARRISDHLARPIRRYALMARSLGAS